MYNWTPWHVGKVRPMRNYVLTTTVFRTDVVKLGELELFQDTTYNPGVHQPIVQKVVAVPRNLSYGRMSRYIELDKGFDAKIQHNRTETMRITPPLPHSMPWLTDMELKRDDVVYVDSFTLATAEKEHRLIECEGVKYYLLSYSDIYFKLVNGEPYMLNGWVLIQPIDNPEAELVTELKKIGFVFPGITIDNNNRRQMGVGDKLGVVRHIGLPVQQYLDPEIEVHDEINVGDTVVFKWGANRRLEAGYSRFFGDTELIVSRRERIVGKFAEDLF